MLPWFNQVAGAAVIFEVQRSSRSEARKEEVRRLELEVRQYSPFGCCYLVFQTFSFPFFTFVVSFVLSCCLDLWEHIMGLAI